MNRKHGLVVHDELFIERENFHLPGKSSERGVWERLHVRRESLRFGASEAGVHARFEKEVSQSRQLRVFAACCSS